MDYHEFLSKKSLLAQTLGFSVELSALSDALDDFQKEIVRWGIQKGRAAVFADTGLGKTRIQIEWAKQTGERTLIAAPLAVCYQTIDEAKLLDYSIKYVRDDSELDDDHQIFITNYERLMGVKKGSDIPNFDASLFGAFVLDESGILKNFQGKTKNALVDFVHTIPFRLACSATPAPNDTIELGSHAEFLGVMTSSQMTSIFFVHEAGVFQGVKESRWRLKKHAEREFYKWLASWAFAINLPSDFGFPDTAYQLPPMQTHVIEVKSDYTPPGMLPGMGYDKVGIADLRRVRKQTLDERVKVVADLVNADNDYYIVWALLNEESDALAKAIPDAVNVEGKMSPEQKAEALWKFAHGETRVLITKGSIAGMGMNFQKYCHKQVMFPDFSWEKYYQQIRRTHRRGQTQDVDIYIVVSSQEEHVLRVLQRKAKEAEKMTERLIAASREHTLAQLKEGNNQKMQYKTDATTGNGWTMLLGDSCERLKEIPSDSVHLSVYSPPFNAMYVYNHSDRDLSNSPDLEAFFEHYSYIVRENLRVTMPGRVCCVHVQEPKTFQNKEGYRGIYDFTGMVISEYVKAGWIYRSRITIDKNPKIVASRNKDTDLLFVTGKRDSTDLAPMSTDYVLVFKKDGDNPTPVKPYENGQMTEQEWIEWAHAVWYGIRETDVLNVAVARENADEKHCSPLQLPLIERCIRLWSNKGELVLSCFAGIGSEGYEAIRNNRQFIGIELKEAYYKQACQYIKNAESLAGQTLFDYAGVSVNG